ncbi:serine/threonine-protein kinase pim-1-like [Cheilinus undulatus]|uniref:serine/threonine-protein kinase pim-1-like n=1 Tax=Cheilinus undulatus TaxID=241271 RepID=UPI001BD66727|nr:serine/threonine-protein kinase pim-1-like [Cheilinus undulatus]
MERCLKRKLQEADVSPRQRVSAGGIVKSSEPKKAGDEPALKRTKACVLTKPFKNSVEAKKDFIIPGLEPAEEKTTAWVLNKLFKYSDEEKEDFLIPGLEPAKKEFTIPGLEPVEEKTAACVLNKLFRYSDEEKGGFAIRRKRTAGDGGEAPRKRSKNSSESSSCSVTWESDSSAPNLKLPESGTENKDGDKELTEEEKIYKMSSSANKSQADFDSKYKVLHPLGKGGYGMIYTGLRISDKLPVAIKYIDAKKVKRQEVICNGTSYNIILEVAFMLKATGLKGEVGQSAAVSLLDWYSLDDRLILVMERPTPCLDLQQHLNKRGGKLREDEAKDILRQLVDVAIEMESKGIFHRDIKPQNVLIQFQSRASRVRLIDFGCASFSSEMFHCFHGTRIYAPPEWLYCGAYQACPTTVWQLGVLFYSLLHGMYTFTTNDFMKGKVEFNWRLSKQTKILLRMCLVKNPEQRGTLQQLRRLLAKKTDFYRV